MAKIYSNQDVRHILAEVCSTCYREAVDSGMGEEEIAATMDGNGRDRFSFDIYAGHYCDRHWRKSGYRDEPATAFDPDYAGERLEEEE